MTTYEQQVINGVPCLVNGTTVYYYDSLCLPWSSSAKEPIRIGALIGGALQLDAGFQERIQSRVDAWLSTVNPVGRNEVVRAEKQSKPKRSPKSTAKDAGTTGNTVTTVATVAEPIATATTVTTAEPVTEDKQPAPKRIIRRRKAVPANAPGV
jgi:hypothetical protein